MKKRGFTLIETIVAIAVLALAITGPLLLVSRGIESSNFARDQITAAFLAQDAMEYILAKRDYNKSEGLDWLDGIDGIGSIDTTTSLSDPDTDIGARLLKYDPAIGYNFSSGTDTRFDQEVAVTNINDNEARISVRIKWQSGILQRFFFLNSHILNSN